MLKYKEPPAYKTDTHVIHFILIGTCFVIIFFAALVYFY